MNLGIESVEFLLRLAKQYMEIKDIDSAVSAYINTLILDPTNQEARQELFKLTNIMYVHKERGHSDPILKAVWTYDGNFIATGDADGNIVIWRYPGGKIIRSFSYNQTCITAISRHPKRPMVATGSDSGDVLIYDIISCRKQLLQRHRGRINTIIWSPEGKSLVSGGNDGKIIVWNPTTGKITRELIGHNRPVLGLSWSSGGRYLLSFSSDGIINIWNPKTGSCLLYTSPSPRDRG